MKKYNLGLIIGRFQTIHLGHQKMIDTAIELCNNVIIFIGSAQESNTTTNPYSYEYRKYLLEKIYGEKIIILPLADAGIGNNNLFGKYVMNNIPKEYGVPDLIITGKEVRRENWFADYEIDELHLSKYMNISATNIRELMLNNNYDNWSKLVPCELHSEYSKMRKVLILSQSNYETKSI